MLTAEDISEIKKSANKNPSVALMLDEWERYSQSPYRDTYITLYNQLADLNAQLEIKPDEKRKRVVGKDEFDVSITVDWMPGKVDLFSDKDTKDFERAIKYFSEMPSLLATLDAIRGKMNPEEQQDLQKNKRLSKNMSVAI